MEEFIKQPGKKRFIGKSDAIFDIVNYAFLVFLLIIVAYPLIYVLSASFSAPYSVTSGRVWLYPVDFSLVGYKTVFKNPDVLSGYRNSIIITLLGTSINIVTTIMCAYPLSVRTFYGRNLFMGLLAFTMLFSGGLIPTFIWINQLGLYNSYFALILPGAVSIYNMVIARTYFQSSIPYDLHESAELDGCSDVRYLLKIVVPLSKPIIAVLALYYAVGHWNSYFSALIYLSDKHKYPLQIILRNIIIQNQIDPSTMVDVDTLLKVQGLSELLKYSLIVVSSVPMLIIYPLVQKHFVKGVMIGALKG